MAPVRQRTGFAAATHARQIVTQAADLSASELQSALLSCNADHAEHRIAPAAWPCSFFKQRQAAFDEAGLVTMGDLLENPGEICRDIVPEKLRSDA